MLITAARFRAHEHLPSGHYLSWTGLSSPSLFPFTTLALPSSLPISFILEWSHFLPSSLPICFIPDWSHFLPSCVHIYRPSTECPEDTATLHRLIIPFPPTLDFIPTQSEPLWFIQDFLHFLAHFTYVSSSLKSNTSRSSLLYQSSHIYKNTFQPYILLSSDYPEDGAGRLIWKVGNYKPISKASYFRILKPSLAMLLEPQIWQTIEKNYEYNTYSGMWHHSVLHIVYWHFRRTFCLRHQVDDIQFKLRHSGVKQTHCKRDRLQAGCSQLVSGTSKGDRTDWQYATTCAVCDPADVNSFKYHCLRSVIF